MGFIEQAYKGKNEWWRFALGFLIIFFGWQFIGIIPLFIVAFNASDDYVQLMESSANAFSDLGIDSNLYLFVILLMFVFGLLSLLVVVKKIHDRSMTSLITSRVQMDWKRYIFGFWFWFLISVAFLVVDYALYPDHYILILNPFHLLFWCLFPSF
jgi:cytochrome c biogenesis protein CcdA